MIHCADTFAPPCLHSLNLFERPLKFVVPAYQRDFVWDSAMTQQLLLDLKDHFDCSLRNEANERTPVDGFELGLLYVQKKADDQYDIIDGQQRLTTLFLIAKALRKELDDPKTHPIRLTLSWPIRPKDTEFLTNPTNDKEVNRNLLEVWDTINAWIKNTWTTPESRTELAKFNDFFFDKVQAYFIPLFEGQSPNQLFEHLGNRGEQLEPQHLIKALLYKRVEDTERFTTVWERCANMDKPIKDLTEAKNLLAAVRSEPMSAESRFLSIDEILESTESESSSKEEKNVNPEASSDPETEFATAKKVIDFENLLLQVLKLHRRRETSTDEISLNENKLVTTFGNWIAMANDDEIERFLARLVRARLFIDHCIPFRRQSENDNEERWVFCEPDTNNPDIEEQKDPTKAKIKRALTTLQASYPQKTWLTWLQEVLYWHEKAYCKDDFPQELCPFNEAYLNQIHKTMQSLYAQYKKPSAPKEIPDWLKKGTNTRHFILYLIDYCLWLRFKEKPDPKDFFEGLMLDGLTSFPKLTEPSLKTTNLNTIEHHLARAKDGTDLIGNLILMSRSENSALNNKNAVEKTGQHTPETMQCEVIYKLTKARNGWPIQDIEAYTRWLIDIFKLDEGTYPPAK